MDTPDVLQVEGINLQEMWRYVDILDVNRLRTNDIWAVNTCVYTYVYMYV